MSELSVSVIVPVFGPEHFLTAMFDALKWTTTDYDLILVDNATGYDMVNAPNLQALVRNTENKGFAEACNYGARCSKSDILVFLNVDTEPQLDWLTYIMAAFEDPDVVMAGPKLVHPDWTIQTTGIRTWHGNGSAGGEEIKDDLPTRDVDGVTGACMAIRSITFNQHGGFDTDFINGYEDVALCLSVREAGQRIRYVAESIVTHYESGSGPERWAHAAQNVDTMNAKWGHR